MYIKATEIHNIYPYTLQRFRRDNPNTSFPENIPLSLLAEYDVYPVTITAAPAYDHLTEQVVMTVVEINGQWTQTWDVVQLEQTAAEANVRARRDQLLTESDWTQGWDISDSIRQPWAVYRQALRDVPQQEGFPYAVTWPTPPN